MPELNELAPLSCAEIDEEHAAYVWGVLEPSERARVERHRAGCASCDERLRVSEQVIAELDEGGPRVSPPPDLRGRVLGAVAALDSSSEPSAHAADAIRAVSPSRSVPPLAHRRRFFAGLATGVAATLAAAALLIVFVAGPTTSGVVPAAGALFHEEPSAQVRPWPWDVLGGGTATSTQRLFELQAASGPARGLLMYDVKTGRGVLMLLDMAPQTKYEVSLVSGSERADLGTLQTDADGFATFVLPRPSPLEQPERIEVTTAESPRNSVLSGTF
jgi:hypothetical protein